MKAGQLLSRTPPQLGGGANRQAQKSNGGTHPSLFNTNSLRPSPSRPPPYCARNVGSACACHVGSACARHVGSACAHHVRSACALNGGSACAHQGGSACARCVGSARARRVGSACATNEMITGSVSSIDTEELVDVGILAPWQALLGFLNDPVGEFSQRDVMEGFKRIAMIVSSHDGPPVADQTTKCIECMDLLCCEMWCYTNSAGVRDVAITLGVMGLAASKGFIDIRNAPTDVVLVGEALMRRLQGKGLQELSVNQLAGVLRCVVHLLPNSVSSVWCADVEQLLLCRLDMMDSDAMAASLLSLSLLSSSTNWKPSDIFLEEVESEVLGRMDSLPPRALAFTLYGIAHLGAKPKPEWKEAASRSFQELQNCFHACDLALCLVAFTTMECGFALGAPPLPTHGRAPLRTQTYIQKRHRQHCTFPLLHDLVECLVVAPEPV